MTVILWVPLSAETLSKWVAYVFFVNKNLNFMNVNLRKFSHEEDIEAGTVKLFVNSLNIFILSIYRAPSGNFAHFLDKLEMTLNLLHSNNTQLIICGDININ